MTKVLYFVFTVFESILAVFGIRSTFEEPPYTVVRSVGDGVQIRAYGPTVAAQTDGDDDAFQRLFAYITGANEADETIAMTTPVEQRGGRLGKPASDAQLGSSPTPMMRFFLPRKIASHPPPPKNGRVTIVRVPSRTVAAIRFSGSLDGASIEQHAATLKSVLARNGIATEGAAYVLGYDPPFTIPFLRRNEVAIDVTPQQARH